jgi:hypothetical protein
MDHFDISFVIWKFSWSRELTKPTLLDPDYFPGSHRTFEPLPRWTQVDWNASMDQVPESWEMSSQKHYSVCFRRRSFVDHPRTSSTQDSAQFDCPNLGVYLEWLYEIFLFRSRNKSQRRQRLRPPKVWNEFLAEVFVHAVTHALHNLQESRLNASSSMPLAERIVSASVGNRRHMLTCTPKLEPVPSRRSFSEIDK